MGTSLQLCFNLAGLSVLIRFNTAFIEILTLKNDQCNQFYTFYTSIKTKSKFLDQF